MSQIISLGNGGIIPPGTAVETITSNSGGAVGPDIFNNINILGINNITGIGNPGTNTITISVTGTTNHDVQLGNPSGSLTSLANGTSGQFLGANTGADPSWQTLTSASESFSAYITPEQVGVTGDGTTFVIPYNAVNFDNGSNFNTGTGVFVAPSDGDYCFGVNMYLQIVSAAHTQGLVSLNINSGATIYDIMDWNPSSVADDNGDSITRGSRIIALSAGDTVAVQVTVYNSTKTVNVNGGAVSAGIFEGFLVTSLGGFGSLTFHGNAGSATPSAGLLNIIGAQGILTSATGNTVTIHPILWTDVTAASQAMVSNNYYIADNAGLLTFTLPVTSARGDTLWVVGGAAAGSWTIAQGIGQNIVVEGGSTTPGVGGSISSSNTGQSIELLCTVASTTWTYINGVGTNLIVI